MALHSSYTGGRKINNLWKLILSSKCYDISMSDSGELDYNIPGQFEVPRQTKDPLIPENLKRINELFQELYNKVPYTELPDLEKSGKSEKLKKYIIYIHEILNQSFNETVKVVHLMANTNYKDYLHEKDKIKKNELLESLLYLRNLMEVLNSLITKDGKLTFSQLFTNEGKPILDGFYSEWDLGDGSYFPIKLTINDYPNITTETVNDVEVINKHKPRLILRIFQIVNGNVQVVNLRFDLDPSSSDKNNPYERIIKLDINYPNQDLTKMYDYTDSFTYHFPVAYDVDFQQFHHICQIIKNNLNNQ